MKLLIFGLGGSELIFVALLVLLLFGGKKIPEMMKGLGQGVKSFKEGMKDVTSSEDEKKDEKKD
ncbi:MAG: twin-arginine translocase TatA/TatE family subunit [Paludibacteraceae bacterium]|nr:twin-arginine translocase TatA/TatE family subunit [Candidatus Physcocola equi]MCQ2234500.1 twin-arginine translocase TatA/TatE family subunit [Paludibacteraceae bacterium]